jgi:hypothetical protein
MPTVQIKRVHAWMSACVLAGAVSAFAEDAAKAAPKPAVNAVTMQAMQSGAKPVSAKAATKAKGGKVAGQGRMQVEVPKATAPRSDASDSKAWQKTHAKGLTEDQKKAFRDRKEGMETLITVIKAKRKALHEAKPEDRAALARELHSLILEKDGVGATAVARVEVPAAKDANSVQAAQTVPKAGVASKAEERAARREEYRKQQVEKYKQWKGKKAETED